jgi:transposase
MTATILTRDGVRLTRKTLPNHFDKFLHFIGPYQHDIAVAVESTFNWYWFVDNCHTHKIEIHLGHAFYMKAIHGDKNKNNNIDSEKIGNLLRSNMLPYAYPYPAEKRATRDLMRRRLYMVHLRSSLIANTRTLFYQYGLIDVTPNLIKNKKTRSDMSELLKERHAGISANVNMQLIKTLDIEIKRMEEEILNHTQSHYKNDLALLMSIPGVGKIIALTILYEIDTIDRFSSRQDFSSYCRLVRSIHTSNGKWAGSSNSKIGNPYLKYAFVEILNTAPTNSNPISLAYEELKKIHDRMKARAIMANRFCTIVYYMLKHKKPFDIELFQKARKKEVVSPALRLEIATH